MEREVWRWSLEFLSRKRMVLTETLMRNVVRSIPGPLSREYFRCKKSVILDVLQEELFTASISEHMLEKLEVLEEFYRCFGFPIPATMPPAYCAIAVDSTLKYLDLPSPAKDRAFLLAVHTIWRGRVHCMETAQAPSSSRGRSKLFTAELKRWSSDIQASLQDPLGMERFRNVNARREAIQKLSDFLAESSEETGPSFLEFVASLVTASAANRGEYVVPAALPTGHEMELGATGSPEHLRTVKDMMNPEPPIEIQSTDAQIENQSTDAPVANAPIENQCTDAPIGNQSEDAPMENQRTDAPNENQRTDAPSENPSADADLHEQRVCQNTDNNEVDDLTKTTTAHQSDVNRPSLMARKNTAYNISEWDSFMQWDESTDGLQGGTSNHAGRIYLPSPKRKKMSPLKSYEPGHIIKRRRRRKWSELEEETLRAAVNEIGEGNWKSILEAHKDVFLERTQVDLKDKWRNLARYGGK